MSKYAQSHCQFNVKILGEERVRMIQSVREYCAGKKISLSDFTAEALKKLLEENWEPVDEISELKQQIASISSRVDSLFGDNEFDKQESPLKEDIDFMFEKVGSEIEDLRSQLATQGEKIDKLIASQNAETTVTTPLGRPHPDADGLSMVENQTSAIAPNPAMVRCLKCGRVGSHRPSGRNSAGKQLYYCGNPEHLGASGKPYRSVKFEVIDRLDSD